MSHRLWSEESELQHGESGGEGPEAGKVIRRGRGGLKGENIAELMEAAQIQGKIGFPVIVHDTGADFRTVERGVLPVTEGDGPFFAGAEGNQGDIGAGDQEIKGFAAAEDAGLQAPEGLAGGRKLIEPGADEAAGFIDPGFVLSIGPEGEEELDLLGIGDGFLAQAKGGLQPGNMAINLQIQGDGIGALEIILDPEGNEDIAPGGDGKPPRAGGKLPGVDGFPAAAHLPAERGGRAGGGRHEIERGEGAEGGGGIQELMAGAPVHDGGDASGGIRADDEAIRPS